MPPLNPQFPPQFYHIPSKKRRAKPTSFQRVEATNKIVQDALQCQAVSDIVVPQAKEKDTPWRKDFLDAFKARSTNKSELSEIKEELKEQGKKLNNLEELGAKLEAVEARLNVVPSAFKAQKGFIIPSEEEGARPGQSSRRAASKSTSNQHTQPQVCICIPD